ncbi:hypothetical protein H1R82_07985 [Thermoactinomyces intermedius]|uniref:Uncharacterized protein n=1 Tax=Thermoactinomyces intermedius TaxID=2024 RepID=A0A8I1A748_THEIN|nr:hypothetical protein [Thermoactinomyces intermedius]MBA4547825.1 hypothetical protein [Thermoactinomyces intermedius]MBA4836564.1 hypothetical protein [Thermoactinomyces intermedius]MBH8593946.1 hypothetical protein [Thermoactinomyces intermedius]
MLWENETWQRKHTKEIAALRERDPSRFTKIKGEFYCFGCWKRYIQEHATPPSRSELPKVSHYHFKKSKEHHFRLRPNQKHIPGCVFRDAGYLREVAQRHGLTVLHDQVICLPDLEKSLRLDTPARSPESKPAAGKTDRRSFLFQELFDGMQDDWVHQRVQADGKTTDLGQILYSHESAHQATGQSAIITGVVQNLSLNRHHGVELTLGPEGNFKVTVSPGHLYDRDFLSPLLGRKIAIYGKVTQTEAQPPGMELISMEKQLVFLDLDEKPFPAFDLPKIKDQRLHDTIHQVLSRYHAQPLAPEDFPFRFQTGLIQQREEQREQLEEKYDRLKQQAEDLQQQQTDLLQQQSEYEEQKEKYAQEKSTKEAVENQLKKEIRQLSGFFKRLFRSGKLKQKQQELIAVQTELQYLTRQIYETRSKIQKLADEQKKIHREMETLKAEMEKIQSEMESVKSSLGLLRQHDELVRSWQKVANHAEHSYLFSSHIRGFHLCLNISRDPDNARFVHVQSCLQPYESEGTEKRLMQPFAKQEIHLEPDLLKPYGKLFNQLKAWIASQTENLEGEMATTPV